MSMTTAEHIDQARDQIAHLLRVIADWKAGATDAETVLGGWNYHRASIEAELKAAVRSELAEARYINFYRCPRCRHEWQDESDAQPDDDCPACGMRHISPYRSEDVA